LNLSIKTTNVNAKICQFTTKYRPKSNGVIAVKPPKINNIFMKHEHRFSLLIDFFSFFCSLRAMTSLLLHTVANKMASFLPLTLK